MFASYRSPERAKINVASFVKYQSSGANCIAGARSTNEQPSRTASYGTEHSDPTNNPNHDVPDE